MAESLLKPLRRYFPHYTVFFSNSAYQLLSDQQSFSLSTQSSPLGLHLTLVTNTYSGRKTELILQRCMAVNSTSQGLYMTISKTGVLEVHGEYSAGEEEGVGRLVGRMIQWYMCQEQKLLATEPAETQMLPEEVVEMGETVRKVAAMLHLREFQFDMSGDRVKLKGLVPFVWSGERYFALSFCLKAHSEAQFLSFRAQSVCKVPANAPILVPSLSLETEKLTITQFPPVSDKANIALSILQAILQLFQGYFLLSERLIVKCPKFDEATKGTLEGNLDREIGGMERAIDLLRALGVPLGRDFQPVPRRSSPYMELALGSVLKYGKAREAFEIAVEAFANRPNPVQFPLVHFDSLTNVIFTDTSDIVRVNSLATRSVSELKRYAVGLIEAIQRCKEAGLGLESVSSAWYIHKWSGAVVLLPTWKQGKLVIRPGEMGNAAIFTLAALKRLKWLSSRKLSYQDFASLLEMPVSIVNFTPPGAISLFQSDTETSPTLPFPIAMERLYWEVLRRKAALALQEPQSSLQVVCEKASNSLRLSTLLSSPTLPASLDISSNFDLVTTLTTLGNNLKSAHTGHICHLLLTPCRIRLGPTTCTPYITGFNISVYPLVVNYVKRLEDPVEWDFLDPAVISYIWWKRDKSQAGKRKRQKYVNRIDWRSDIYSFAMLIYAVVFNKKRPFQYVREAETWQQFFYAVVKQHRRPLIAEELEKDFPKAVDLLHRSWERPQLRPSLDELVSALPNFAEMQLRIQQSTNAT